MSPERFRLMVSGVLLVGVATSAGLIALGFVTAFAIGWQGSLLGASAGSVSALSEAASNFAALPDRLAVLEPLALAQLGLLVLLATPVVRVAASVVGFALEGDRLYTAITAAVLTVLLVSIFFVR